MSSQSRNYEWLRRARGIALDGCLPPFSQPIEFDAVHTVRMMKRIGANLIVFGAIGKWAHFPNEFIPTHPGLGDRDLIGEIIEAARVEKMRVAITIPLCPVLPVELVEKIRPEWQWLGPAGKPRYLSHFAGGSAAPVCLNSPFRQAILAAIRQVVSIYEFHAICFPSPLPPERMADDICYCESCKKVVVEKLGRELPAPTSASPDDQRLLKKLQQWHQRRGLQLLHEANILVRSIREIPILLSGADLFSKEMREQIKAADALVVGGDGAFMDRMDRARFAVGGKRVVLQEVGTHDLWPRLLLGRNELAQESVSTLACGAVPLIADGNKLLYDEVQAAPISRAFGFIVRNEEALDGLEPVRFAGIFTPRSDSHAMANETRGLSFALWNAHVQTEPIAPDGLDSADELSKYRVLCLGDTGWISGEQIEAVRKFVEKGGGLVATYRTSFLDESGREKGGFALAEVLGVKPLKLSMEMLDRIAAHQFHGEPTDVYISLADQPVGALDVTALTKRLPQGPFVPIEANEDAFVAAHTVFGGVDDPFCPAITLREVGKGRAVYISSALGSLYLEHRAPSVRDLVAACVNWAGGGWGPFSILGPASLFASLNEKPGLQVLFLINCTGERHEHPGAPCEHVAPLEKVNVHLRTTESVGQVRELVSGNDLDFERDKDIVRVAVPRIEEFAAVAFYAEGPKADPGLRL